MKALLILFHVYGPKKIAKEQALVGTSYEAQQRPGFRTKSVRIEEPAENRTLVEALG